MPPITYTINGGEFHFCVFNAFLNSSYYGSPTANSLLWCQTVTDEATQDFVFTSNGVSYDSIHLVGDKDTPDNRKMYYVSGGVETLVYHNNVWTLEAYKILTYETQSVRERIYELITGDATHGVSGGFSAPSGTYKVSAPLVAVAGYSAFYFSEFVSNGATFNSINWNLETGSSPEATVKYDKPSVNDVYTPTTVYSDGWLEVGYETITIPDGAYMSYRTIDIFSERLTQVSRLSVDLTTLSGWASLSAGSHSIQIVAKASGYRDSEKSEAVQVTKAITLPTKGYTVDIGTSNDPLLLSGLCLGTDGTVVKLLTSFDLGLFGDETIWGTTTDYLASTCKTGVENYLTTIKTDLPNLPVVSKTAKQETVYYGTTSQGDYETYYISGTDKILQYIPNSKTSFTAEARYPTLRDLIEYLGGKANDSTDTALQFIRSRTGMGAFMSGSQELSNFFEPNSDADDTVYMDIQYSTEDILFRMPNYATGEFKTVGIYPTTSAYIKGYCILYIDWANLPYVWDQFY